MLHITNGDSAAAGIRQVVPDGYVLAWRDALHVGPVPAGLSLPELSALRTRFIEEQGWAPAGTVAASFAERDAALAGFHQHDEVCLWFEHDLYDQLQLLQVLDWLAGEGPGDTALRLICISELPGVERFYGLGQLTPAQLATLYPQRRPISREQLDLAGEAWAAFRSADPTNLAALLAGDTSALPFLRAALPRLLAELPAVGDGLSRTERLILENLASGPQEPTAAFRASQEREDAPFLGDTIFWWHVHALGTAAHPPLLARRDGQLVAPPKALPSPQSPEALTLELTDVGQALLGGQTDYVRLNGIDRWLGGTHLGGPEAEWRWDADHQVVVEA
jgi:hypothetical protein